MDCASTSSEQLTPSTSYASKEELEQNVSSQVPSLISLTNDRNHLKTKTLQQKDVNPLNVLNKKRKLTTEFDDSLEDVFVPSKVSTKVTVKNDNKKKTNNKKTRKNNAVAKRKCVYFNSPQSLEYTQSNNYEEDLKLALALSLEDASTEESSSQVDSANSEEPATSYVEPVKRSSRLLKKWTGKVKKFKSKSVLLSRTKEDRERIITQKVGIVLLENASKSEDFCSCGVELKSFVLKRCSNENAFLWELSKSSLDNEALIVYWVNALSAFIEPTTTPTGENKEIVQESEMELDSPETFFPCLPESETAVGEESCTQKENYSYSTEVAKNSEFFEETNADSNDIEKSNFSVEFFKIQPVGSHCSSIEHRDVLNKDVEDVVMKEKSGMKEYNNTSQEIEISSSGDLNGACEDFTQKTANNSEIKNINCVNEECHSGNSSIHSEKTVPESPFQPSGSKNITGLSRISSSSVETVPNSPKEPRNEICDYVKAREINITSHEHSLPHSDFKFNTRSENYTEKNCNSLERLSKDWEAIFGDIETSDIKVQLDNNRLYPLHKLVLKVRCPQILSDIDTDLLNWTHYSYHASIAVLKYIYTGQTSHFDNLTDDDKQILSRMDNDYNLSISNTYILDTQSIASDIYSTSTRSPPNVFENLSEFSRKLSSPEIPSISGTSFRGKACASTPNDFRFKSRAISPDIFESDLNQPEENEFEKTSNIFPKSQDEIKNKCDDSSKIKLEENQNEKTINSFRHSSSAWNISDVFRESIDTRCSEIKIEQKIEILPEGTSKLTPEFEIPSLKSEELVSNNNSCNTDNVENNFSSNNEDFYHDFSYYDSYPNEYDNPANEIQGNQILNKSFEENVSSFKSSVESNPSRSLIDRYFQSSFPEVDVDQMLLDEGKGSNTTESPEVEIRNLHSPERIAAASRTPRLENSIIIDKATPQQDYGTMDTPDLKNELKKFGLKPTLDRRKAHMLLRYIYEQTHPPTSQIPGYVSPMSSSAPPDDLPQTQTETSIISIDSD